MAAYDRAIAIKPENAEAWRDRGAVVSELKQDTDKIDSRASDITNASDSKVEQPKSADSM
jgi:regulator of sirC expression with transglutaminase-like and TPR domain